MRTLAEHRSVYLVEHADGPGKSAATRAITPYTNSDRHAEDISVWPVVFEALLDIVGRGPR